MVTLPFDLRLDYCGQEDGLKEEELMKGRDICLFVCLLYYKSTEVH